MIDDNSPGDRLDTYCGLYCGACVIYSIHRNGKAVALAEEIGRTPEDIICNGCRSSLNSTCARSCRIKRCAIENQVEHCFECPDYPCTTLVEFKNDEYLHRSFVISNLEEIREKGVKRWNKEQKKRWQCPSCNESFNWYEEKCKKCGATLFNCINERLSG